MVFQHHADLRYAGQSFELTIPLSTPVADAPGSPDLVRQTLQQFHREHERAYGYNAPAEPVEWVNVRLTALGRIAKPGLRDWAPDGCGQTARKPSRPVYFAEHKGTVDCPVYDRYQLAAGSVIEGPAIVEELDSTTVIHPGYRAQVDRFGNLILQQKEINHETHEIHKKEEKQQ
jgi:N-methylhydantoinase A